MQLVKLLGDGVSLVSRLMVLCALTEKVVYIFVFVLFIGKVPSLEKSRLMIFCTIKVSSFEKLYTEKGQDSYEAMRMNKWFSSCQNK